MNRTVYFADRSVLFAAAAPDDARPVVAADVEGVSRSKILKILESHNSVVVAARDPDAAFAAFAAEFRAVEAAGGVVVDERGAWLMIRRNGRWDLPKGHVEPGEELAACAEREVEEETGVAARVVRPLCDTLHAYWFPPTACWELKRTHWYELHVAEHRELRPQAEEGIEAAVWCDARQIGDRLREAFPTIRCVAAAMEARE